MIRLSLLPCPSQLLQAVRGDVQFALEWQFTREGLLLKEVELLERLLAEKVWILYDV